MRNLISALQFITILPLGKARDFDPSKMVPYFPLVVVFCQRYVKSTGIGTVVAMMLPYSLWFLVTWTIFLLIYYALGLPLGLAASYTYP